MIPQARTSVIAAALLTASLLQPSAGVTQAGRAVPLPPNSSQWTGTWQTADLREHVRDPEAVRSAVDEIGSLDGVYSVLVLHEGRLVLESYFREGFREKPHNLKSASKSVLSALTGIAVAQGHLTLDQPITDFLPQARRLASEKKKQITVRHLLTMTTGLAARSYESYNELAATNDWVAAIFEVPLVAEPGTRFQYSTGNTHLLSAVLSAATGTSTRQFAEEALFEPMGITIKGWEQDPQGIHLGGNNLSLLPRDMAKFGQLFLDGGRWGDRQLIPWEWVVESTTPQPLRLHQIYGGYGYLWYVDLVYEGAFVAVGFGGQYIYVSPAHDAVVVITSTLESKGTAWTADLFRLLREGILARIAPSRDYYARLGKRPLDPALESLRSAIEEAEQSLALLRANPVSTAESDGRNLGWTTTQVNLRRGPATTTARVRLLEHGEELRILEVGDGWLRVRAGQTEGWVDAEYVALPSASWRTEAAALRNELEIFSRTVESSVGAQPLRPRSPEAPRGRIDPSRRPMAQDAPVVSSIELDSARARIARLEEQLDEVEDLSTSRGRELETARTRLDAFEDQRTRLVELEAALAAAAERETALSNRLTDAEQRAATATEAAAGRETLEGRLAASQLRVSTLEAEIAETGRAKAELEDRLHDAESRDVERTRTLQHAADARSNLASQLSAARDELEASEKIREALAASEEDRTRRIEELLTEVSDVTRDNARIEAQVAALEEQISDALDLAASRDRELEAAQTRLDAFEQQRARLLELDEALAAAAERETALSDRLADAEQRAATATEAAAGRETLEGRLSASQQRVSTLEAEIAESRRAQTELEDRLHDAESRDVERLEALQEADASQSTLEKELAAARNDVRELLAKSEGLDTARGEVAVLEKRIAEMEDLSAARARALKEADDARSTLASQLTAARDELAASEENRAALAASEEARSARIDELLTEVTDVGRDNARIEAQVTALEDQLADAVALSAARGRELEATRTRLDAFDKQRPRLLELEEALAAASERETALSGRLADAEQRAATATEAAAGRDTLEGRLAASQQRVSTLETEIAETRRAKAELEDLLRDAEQGAAMATEAAAERETLGVRLAASQQRVSTLEAEITETGRAKAELENLLQNAESREVERLKAVRDADAARSTLESELAAARDDVRSLLVRSEELDTARGEVAVLEKRIAELEELSAARARTLEEADDARSTLTSQLDAARNELAASEESRTALAASEEARSERIDQLVTELTSVTRDNTRMAARVAALEKKLEDRDQRLAMERWEEVTAIRETGVGPGTASGARDSGIEAAVEETVTGWAHAWSSKNADAYLDFYDSDFQGADGIARSEWEARFRSELASPAPIDVAVGQLSVESIGTDRARATFALSFRSLLRDVFAVKELELERRDGTWKISGERTVEPSRENLPSR